MSRNLVFFFLSVLLAGCVSTAEKRPTIVERLYSTVVFQDINYRVLTDDRMKRVFIQKVRSTLKESGYETFFTSEGYLRDQSAHQLSFQFVTYNEIEIDGEREIDPIVSVFEEDTIELAYSIVITLNDHWGQLKKTIYDIYHRERDEMVDYFISDYRDEEIRPILLSSYDNVQDVAIQFAIDDVLNEVKP